MQRFRFIPDARLDDIMISWATDQAGVGPHFDSYDVFLIQATGKRLWRIGRQKGDRSLVPGLPVRILANFEAEEEFLLEAGDMLYLPPGWAHDGIAVGSDCMTVSVGFRVPKRADVATELAGRMADAFEDDTLYRDPQQQATQEPSRIPDELIEFAHESLLRMATDTDSMMCALGEWLTEPKPQVWFEGKGGVMGSTGIELDAKTNMQYSSPWLFINGESFEVAGKDEKWLQLLANQRQLPLNAVKKLSPGASEVLQDWLDQGWLHLVAK
jgi:50S ribosomal protein L16 3-hydroxylase